MLGLGAYKGFTAILEVVWKVQLHLEKVDVALGMRGVGGFDALNPGPYALRGLRKV